MIGPSFLNSLAIALAFAAATTWFTRRLKQQAILGYIAAGVLAGPHLFSALTADPRAIRTLSDLGVILLMFSLGLEFSLRRLARIGAGVVLIATLEISLMVWLGHSIGRLFGWEPLECLLAGAMVAISSTVVVAKTLEHSEGGRLKDLVFGILVVEDLAAILLLAGLTTLSTGKGLPPKELMSTTALLGAFLTLLVGAGYLIVPRLVRGASHAGGGESLLIVGVGVAFTLAALSQAAGYPAAMGAFLAGALAAESGEASALHRVVRPVRDLFGAMFFVSVGMEADPRLLGAHMGAIAAFSALVIVGKFAGVGLGSFLSGQNMKTSVQGGLALGQIGEFAFIMASALAARGSVGSFILPLAVGVSVVTTFLSPILAKASGPLSSWLDRSLPGPLQTFTSLYGNWISDLKARARSDPRWDLLRKLARVVVLDLIFLAGLAIVASLLAGPVGSWIARGTGLSPRTGRTIVAALALILSVPFLAGLIRTSRALGSRLAEMVVAPAPLGRADTGEAPRRALRTTFQITAAILVGLPLVAIVQPFVPLWLGAGVLGLMVAVLGAGFWRVAENLQGHVRAGAEVVAEILARHGPKARQEGLDKIHDLMPGLGELVSVRLEPKSALLGRTLAQANLRGLTGATVLTIRRGDHTITVPASQEELRAGDVLCLSGSAEAIRKAQAMF